MWAASSSSPTPFCNRFTNPTRPPPRVPVSVVSGKSQPPKTNAENTTPNNNISINTIGHKILSAVKPPNPNRAPKQESAAEISGSDVLRALQKAAAVKEKNIIRQAKEKKKEASADGTASETNRGVRLLRIKSDWGLRLTVLEKRLKEMSDTEDFVSIEELECGVRGSFFYPKQT